MRHGPKVWTEKIVTERLAAGHGSGEGADYRPWHSVHDFSSRGRQTRTAMRKVNRVVHTHSYIERAFLLVAEFQNAFYGIKEQVAIPREITLAIAEKLGIRHPTYPVSHAPVVMSFDFVFETVDSDGVIHQTPWDCKREAELQNPRIIEKLAIHQAATNHLGMEPSRLFTEKSVSKQVLRNIEWIRATLPLAGEPASVHELFATEQIAMLGDVAGVGGDVLVKDYCTAYDKRRGFERGMALRVLGWLMWDHKVSIDLEGRDIPQQLLPPLKGGPQA